MRNMRTIHWSIGALVICAGLAALKTGIAQETSDRDEARDEASDLSREEDARQRERRRERDRTERGERGERAERGEMSGEEGRGEGGRGGYGGEGGAYGGGGGGYGGGRGGYGGFGEYGGGRGGYGRGYGSATIELKPDRALELVKKKADALDALKGANKRIVMMHAQPEAMNRLREAATALVEADHDDARENAERQLNELLDEYFEEDIKRREEELANVERRVKELRELLERRREKKDDIIRLQVEVLRNEADGLGFFSAEGPGGGPKSDVFFLQTAPAAGLPPGPPQFPGQPLAPPAPAVAPAPVAAPRQR